MTPERHQQIKKLFHEARERVPEARASYLDEACQGDAELRQEVASLLRAYEQLGDFIQEPDAAAQGEEQTVEHAVLERGQLVGHYRIERQLGAGGMGVVYLAHDTKLGRPVTLKLLQARYTQERERMRRFQQEARAASALNHPNILTIYEVGHQAAAEAEGAYYLVAEFVQGQTLRESFRTEALSLGNALDIGIQITDAIAAAHQAGIIHRDIKPENVMLRPDGIVKVLDFGLAKLTEQAERSPGTNFTTVNTQPGLVMGTVAYMSPEQARGVDVDTRTDLFSVGVVLYELLTGRKPFQGETPSDVIAALLERQPSPLGHYVSGLPTALEQVVSHALAKAPDERYQTAQELGAALRELKQELEFAAHLGRSGSQENPLARKVGAAAHGEEVTRVLSTPTEKQSAPRVSLEHFQRRYGRVVFLAVLVLLLPAGVWLWQHRQSANSSVLNSIAVLPFRNVGNDPQMEYLPDGLSESIINALAQLPGLRVMARSTVFTYKGREVDPRQVGEALQVRAVVIGQVQRQGNRLLIRVELVDATDGTRLWGDQYQPPATDLLAVQSEIAREIAGQLRLTLNNADRQRLAQPETENREAHQLYLQGRFFWNERTPESLNKSIECYQQAIAKDPNYALAHAGLAGVYAVLSAYTDTRPREAATAAKAAAATALKLDPQLSEAHAALGFVLYAFDWDYPGAERELQRAIALNPNDATAHRWYSLVLAGQGRLEAALIEAKAARDLDPIATSSYAALGGTYYYLRQSEQALQQFQKAVELNSRQPGLYSHLGTAYTQQGRYDEAIATFKQAIALGDPNEAPAYLGTAYALAGRRTEARQVLTELEPRAQRGQVFCVPVAEIHAALGNRDQAFVWLERALERREEPVVWLKVNPRLDSLRADPRFEGLLRRLGLAS